MTQQNTYTPPKVWEWQNDNGGTFSNVNRPTAGAQFEQTLPRGNKPLQLYSMNTPNGVKVNIMLKELAALQVTGAAFDGYKIDIFTGQQFGSGFVALNPNAKIPALLDQSGDTPIPVFESGAILMYLAEKFQHFMPLALGAERTECLTWVMWQMGSAPYLGGGFGHFYKYAPEPMQYPIDRFTMEVKRQLDLLDKQLAKQDYLCSFGYSIADMAVWPWYGRLVLGEAYDAAEFLQADSYTHVMRWAKRIAARDAVKQAIDMPLIEWTDNS